MKFVEGVDVSQKVAQIMMKLKSLKSGDEGNNSGETGRVMSCEERCEAHDMQQRERRNGNAKRLR